MALPRSHAGVRLRAKAHSTRAAIFSAPDSRRASARIYQVTCVLVERRLDPRLKLRLQTSNIPKKVWAFASSFCSICSRNLNRRRNRTLGRSKKIPDISRRLWPVCRANASPRSQTGRTSRLIQSSRSEYARDLMYSRGRSPRIGCIKYRNSRRGSLGS